MEGPSTLLVTHIFLVRGYQARAAFSMEMLGWLAVGQHASTICAVFGPTLLEDVGQRASLVLDRFGDAQADFYNQGWCFLAIMDFGVTLSATCVSSSGMTKPRGGPRSLRMTQHVNNGFEKQGPITQRLNQVAIPMSQRLNHFVHSRTLLQ